jgi:hypothetical protein
MMRTIGLLLLGLLALTAGCFGDYGNCGDGKDNDGDGVIDDEDPGCAVGDGDTEGAADPIAPPCRNGRDDDGDLEIDYPNDPGCRSADDDDETDPPDPPPRCNDGIDNDADGIIDYPRDPGCVDLEDDDEFEQFDTQCSNGSDDDGDGDTDYPDDTGCTNAADPSEENPPFMSECGTYLVIDPFPAAGEAEHDFAGDPYNNIQSPECGGFGREWLWTYTVASTAALVVSTQHDATNLDTVVYVRGACRDTTTEEGCHDDVTEGHASFLVVPRIDPGTYFIVLDTYSMTDTGHARITVEERVPAGDPCTVGGMACAPDLTCREVTPGGGTICAPHECEDGSDNDGDGKTDFPNDSGCPNGDDDTELIAPGDPIPACGNGVDDEGDALIDYPLDPGCSAAADADELECIGAGSIMPIPAAGASGDTAVGGSGGFTASCSTTSSTTRENVWSWKTSTTLNWVRFTVTWDAFFGDTFALSLRRGGCGATAEVGCIDGDTSGTVVLTFNNPVVNNTYLLFVDGGIGIAGFSPYDLAVTGEIASGATCTPGDTRFTCVAGTTCNGGSMTCTP